MQHKIYLHVISTFINSDSKLSKLKAFYFLFFYFAMHGHI